MGKMCKNCKYCSIYAPWIGKCRKAPCRTEYDKKACGKYEQASQEKILEIENFLNKTEDSAKRVCEKIHKLVSER